MRIKTITLSAPVFECLYKMAMGQKYPVEQHDLDLASARLAMNATQKDGKAISCPAFMREVEKVHTSLRMYCELHGLSYEALKAEAEANLEGGR